MSVSPLFCPCYWGTSVLSVCLSLKCNMGDLKAGWINKDPILPSLLLQNFHWLNEYFAWVWMTGLWTWLKIHSENFIFPHLWNMSRIITPGCNCSRKSTFLCLKCQRFQSKIMSTLLVAALRKASCHKCHLHPFLEGCVPSHCAFAVFVTFNNTVQ